MRSPTRRRNGSSTPSMSPHLVRRAKYYIETHLARIEDVREVAEGLEVSCERLCDRFREVEGKPLEEYIRQCRVTYLKLYLSSTNLNSEQIAQRVGFKSVEAADRAFKESTGHKIDQFREVFQLGESW